MVSHQGLAHSVQGLLLQRDPHVPENTKGLGPVRTQPVKCQHLPKGLDSKARVVSVCFCVTTPTGIVLRTKFRSTYYSKCINLGKIGIMPRGQWTIFSFLFHLIKKTPSHPMNVSSVNFMKPPLMTVLGHISWWIHLRMKLNF